MGHNRDYKPEDILFPDQVITESHLVEEMEKSYIEYAMSVIVGRALPDVRDGLTARKYRKKQTGRRTPRAFVPLRSTAGRRPLHQ